MKIGRIYVWVCINALIMFFLLNIQSEAAIIQGIAEETYKAGEQESPYQAKIEAKKLALRKFVEKTVGIYVNYIAEAKDTHLIYSIIDAWASAHVYIMTVYIDDYSNYIGHYRALVSTTTSEVEQFRKDMEEIRESVKEGYRQELIERMRRHYVNVPSGSETTTQQPVYNYTSADLKHRIWDIAFYKTVESNILAATFSSVYIRYPYESGEGGGGVGIGYFQFRVGKEPTRGIELFLHAIGMSKLWGHIKIRIEPAGGIIISGGGDDKNTGIGIGVSYRLCSDFRLGGRFAGPFIGIGYLGYHSYDLGPSQRWASFESFRSGLVLRGGVQF